MSQSNYHILIVDDAEMNRDLLKRRLERADFQITTAANGKRRSTCYAWTQTASISSCSTL